jgi:hypothetical protein
VIRHRLTILLASLLLLAAARPARAQDAGTTVAGLAPSDFFIGIQRENGVSLTDFEIGRFFNKANCDCTTNVLVFVTLLPTGFAKRATTPPGTIDFWIGSDCATPTTRALNQCLKIDSVLLTTFLQQGKRAIPTTARVMSVPPLNGAGAIVDGGALTTFPQDGNPTCTSPNGQRFTSTVWALVDYGSDGVYDLSVTRAVDVRLDPPPGPAGVSLGAGNEALIMNWTQVDSAMFPDLQGYQILCQRGPGLQVFADGTFTPGFQTCPATEMGTGLEALDPLFACSPLLTASTTSFRIQVLQNGITYGAAVVSVDIAGNASAPDIFFNTPVKTQSFYDIYREPNPDSGKATGGFCAIGRRGPAGPAAVWGTAGLAAIGLLAAGLRRRRRGR